MDKTRKTEKFVLWRWVLWLSPVWWFMGGILLVYHTVSLWMLMSGVFKRKENLYLPASINFLSGIFLIYLFSILIHTSSEPFARILASCYNLSFWIMGIGVILYFSNLFDLSHIPFIYKTFRGMAVMLAGLSLWAWALVLMGYKQAIFATPLSSLTKLLGDTALVKQSVSAMLLVYDWFAQAERPRFNALMPYPTATAALLVLVLFMFFAATHEKKGGMPFLLRITVIASCAAGLFLTYARMAVFAFLLSFGIVHFVEKKRFVIWLAVLVGLSFLLLPFIAQALTFLMGLREGSTSTRLDLYAYSLQMLRGAEWLIGMGIRPRDESFIFPIGSHSTFVSLTFRTGLVGIIIFLSFQVSLLMRWFDLKKRVRENPELFFFWKGLGWVFWMMLFWMLTEDIDAPQLLAFTYFSLIGIFEGFRRKVLQHAKTL